MNNRYGVIAIMLEFLISIVVLIGGGFMLYAGKSTDVAISAITTVITFWFVRRQVDQFLNGGGKQDNNNQSPPNDQTPKQN